ncbi:MAG TPA: ATP synthase F0 subunit B, partial [Porphyromonadaceae bacterium]|nr:ATP synthase F0 subunit B [Porphyromonadaceae bacterium]
KEYIDSSLLAAKEAHEELEKVKTTSEALLSETRTEQMQILQTTEQTRAKMVEEAKANAKLEADKIVAEARKQIEAEKQNALQSLRSEIASLSIEVAEKILREKIGNKEEQMNMIDRLLDEIEISKS